ncbi:Rap1a/Tai family immunity protein [Marinobacter metalliresistant]|uniref:Rap1a/Tai family immunity protein n=1 Tax=Marinobacter metalliresistant TaxID=2961995 RepID=UPI0035E45AAD
MSGNVSASRVLGDGNALLSSCSAFLRVLDRSGDGSDGFSAGACVGYVTGASDFNTVHAAVSGGEKEGFFCVPPDVPLGQKVRVLVQYLKANPSELNRLQSILTMNAFSEAFPCK